MDIMKWTTTCQKNILTSRLNVVIVHGLLITYYPEIGTTNAMNHADTFVNNVVKHFNFNVI